MIIIMRVWYAWLICVFPWVSRSRKWHVPKEIPSRQGTPVLFVSLRATPLIQLCQKKQPNESDIIKSQQNKLLTQCNFSILFVFFMSYNDKCCIFSQFHYKSPWSYKISIILPINEIVEKNHRPREMLYKTTGIVFWLVKWNSSYTRPSQWRIQEF